MLFDRKRIYYTLLKAKRPYMDALNFDELAELIEFDMLKEYGVCEYTKESLQCKGFDFNNEGKDISCHAKYRVKDHWYTVHLILNLKTVEEGKDIYTLQSVKAVPSAFAKKKVELKQTHEVEKDKKSLPAVDISNASKYWMLFLNTVYQLKDSGKETAVIKVRKKGEEQSSFSIFPQIHIAEPDGHTQYTVFRDKGGKEWYIFNHKCIACLTSMLLAIQEDGSSLDETTKNLLGQMDKQEHLEKHLIEYIQNTLKGQEKLFTYPLKFLRTCGLDISFKPQKSVDNKLETSDEGNTHSSEQVENQDKSNESEGTSMIDATGQGASSFIKES